MNCSRQSDPLRMAFEPRSGMIRRERASTHGSLISCRLALFARTFRAHRNVVSCSTLQPDLQPRNQR